MKPSSRARSPSRVSELAPKPLEYGAGNRTAGRLPANVPSQWFATSFPGGASRLAALLLGHIRPVCSLAHLCSPAFPANFGAPKPCPPSREARRRDLDEARRVQSGRRRVVRCDRSAAPWTYATIHWDGTPVDHNASGSAIILGFICLALQKRPCSQGNGHAEEDTVFSWRPFSSLGRLSRDRGRGACCSATGRRCEARIATADPPKQGCPRNGRSTAKTSSGGRRMAAARRPS